MKKLLWILLAIVLLGGGYGLYLYFKPHRNIQAEEAAYELKAEKLVSAYAAGQKAADSLYLDKVVKVEGVLTEKGSDFIKLEHGIYCNRDTTQTLKKVQIDDKIKVKGRVVGFDELFGEVKLDHCRVLKPE